MEACKFGIMASQASVDREGRLLATPVDRRIAIHATTTPSVDNLVRLRILHGKYNREWLELGPGCEDGKQWLEVTGSASANVFPETTKSFRTKIQNIVIAG